MWTYIPWVKHEGKSLTKGRNTKVNRYLHHNSELKCAIKMCILFQPLNRSCNDFLRWYYNSIQWRFFRFMSCIIRSDCKRFILKIKLQGEVTEFLSRECHPHQTRAENWDLNPELLFLKNKYINKEMLLFHWCRYPFCEQAI